MACSPHYPMDAPATYRIRFYAGPSTSWLESLGNSTTVTPPGEDDPQTLVVVSVTDQAELIGLLNALVNLGNAVVAVERLAEAP